MQNSAQPINPIYDLVGYRGLTKREYFAGLSLQGLLSHGINEREDKSLRELYPNKTVLEAVTYTAVQYADQLLKELENGSKI